MLLKDKVAIITGGTQGIGAGIADEFKKQGAICEVFDYTTCDVTDFEACEKLVNEIMEKHGKIDILVNNAGITRDKLMLKMSPEDFEAVINVNLTGTFNMTKCILPSMLKARAGRIINISSVMGIAGNAGQANYSASKAGIIGFTKSIAKEVGARGITSNAIAPGFIKTAMTEELPDSVKEEFLKSVDLKRMGETEDVANAAVFLASEMASYITGQVLVVDGGLI
jgi:3-oxoacyl-[acyl-carrier protein] reductase